jgi:anaerobic magnesium-protoporphyrin IX monomethyl ester cyclase
VIAYTREQGVMVHGSFMLGFPTETEADAEATIRWALDSRLHTAAFYRVIPYWGTELSRMAAAQGARLPENLERYEFHKSSDINVSAMPDEVLTRVRRSAYRRFYLSARRLASIFRVLPNRRTLLPRLFALWVRKAFVW